MQIDFNDVLKKLQQLYPTQTAHAIAEVRVDMLTKALEEKGGEDD